MAKHFLLFGCVTFFLSVVLFFFLVDQDPVKALLSGAIALPAAFLGVLALDASRKQQVRYFAKRRQGLMESVTLLTDELEQDEQELSALRVELGQLQIQIREKWQQKDDLTRQLTAIAEQRYALQRDYEAEYRNYQQISDQIQQRQQELQELEELLETDGESNTVRLRRSRHTDNPDELTEEVGRLQMQINEQRQQKDKLTQEVSNLKVERHHLKKELQQLEAQLTELRQQYQQQQQFLAEEPTSRPAKSAAAPTLFPTTPSPEPRPIRKPIAPIAHSHSPQLPNSLPPQLPSPPTPNAELPNSLTPPQLHSSTSSPPSLPAEWTDFMVQLPEHEFQVLKAIVEQDNPAPTIRRIAENQMTMPELLIDAINERALETIGDMVIEPGSTAGAAAIAPEHLAPAQQVIATYEYLMK